MRERADRHVVGAGRCELRDPLQRHAAGDLDFRTSARPVHRFANLLGCHVVEQDECRAGAKRLIHLVERLGFDLDGHLRIRGAHPVERGADAAGEVNVVFFDEYGVVQAKAVIARPAGADGVFLERAQSRRRLARVEHGNAPAGGIDKLSGARRDARQPLKQIERGTFADEQRARRSNNLGDLLAASTPVAVVLVERERRAVPFVRDLAEHLARDVKARDHAIGFDQEHTVRPLIGTDDRVGREVAAADVLLERATHDVLILRWSERFDHAIGCPLVPFESFVSSVVCPNSTAISNGTRVTRSIVAIRPADRKSASIVSRRARRSAASAITARTIGTFIDCLASDRRLRTSPSSSRA